MKPLRQTKLTDFFPEGEERHRPRRPDSIHNFDDIRRVGRHPITGLSTKWRTIMSLEMQGHTKAQIAKLVGMSTAGLCNVTTDPRYVEARDAYLRELDREFFEMKPQAFAALRSGLGSSDENTALRAAEVWFKGASFGGYSKTPPPDQNVTAEDVARQLLQVKAENVQININSGPPDANQRLVERNSDHRHPSSVLVRSTPAEPSAAEGDL